MDLQRNNYRFCTLVQISAILTLWVGIFACQVQPAASQSTGPKPALIRDTDAAEGKDADSAEAPKEPNPLLSEQNFNIGNFYYKKKNYSAAIRRYLDAIEYQPGSARACDALARAYEKNDQAEKAIAALKEFIEKNPNSPKLTDFKTRLAKLEKGPAK
jgi:outer membrane protein assembly factor BamD (BamD/ComL family)